MRSIVLASCIGITVLFAAMSIVCVWQITEDLSLRRLSNESRNWPSAMGEIVDAKLDRSGGRGQSIAASVRYRFTVGAKTFEGHTIAFERPRSSAAENAVQRYRPGTKVRVSFRPRDPAFSVLVSDSWSGWLRLAALAFAAIGTALFAVTLVGVSVRVANGVPHGSPR